MTDARSADPKLCIVCGVKGLRATTRIAGTLESPSSAGKSLQSRGSHDLKY